jgi:hypothetical protein
MAIQTQVLIHLPTHHAHITVSDQGVITVFKYTDSNCDFDVFRDANSLAASDYVTEPLPNSYMRVVVHGDASTDGPM